MTCKPASSVPSQDLQHRDSTWILEHAGFREDAVEQAPTGVPPHGSPARDPCPRPKTPGHHCGRYPPCHLAICPSGQGRPGCIISHSHLASSFLCGQSQVHPVFKNFIEVKHAPKIGVYSSMNFHTLNTPRSRADMLAPEEFLGLIQPLHRHLGPCVHAATQGRPPFLTLHPICLLTSIGQA